MEDFTVYRKILPERSAVYADFPASLHKDIKEYLSGQGIERLYVHQAQMYEEAEEGKHVVITTSTASGKTLSFLLPVLQSILENPLTRAIFIYPTKCSIPRIQHKKVPVYPQSTAFWHIPFHYGIGIYP